jgi:hypothetical protein
MFAEEDRIGHTEGPEVHLRIAMEDMVKDLKPDENAAEGKETKKDEVL